MKYIHLIPIAVLVGSLTTFLAVPALAAPPVCPCWEAGILDTYLALKGEQAANPGDGLTKVCNPHPTDGGIHGGGAQAKWNGPSTGTELAMQATVFSFGQSCLVQAPQGSGLNISPIPVLPAEYWACVRDISKLCRDLDGML